MTSRSRDDGCNDKCSLTIPVGGGDAIADTAWTMGNPGTHMGAAAVRAISPASRPEPAGEPAMLISRFRGATTSMRSESSRTAAAITTLRPKGEVSEDVRFAGAWRVDRPALVARVDGFRGRRSRVRSHTLRRPTTRREVGGGEPTQKNGGESAGFVNVKAERLRTCSSDRRGISKCRGRCWSRLAFPRSRSGIAWAHRDIRPSARCCL